MRTLSPRIAFLSLTLVTCVLSVTAVFAFDSSIQPTVSRTTIDPQVVQSATAPHPPNQESPDNNQPIPFWDRFKFRIIVVSGLLVFESILIAALLFERNKHLRATRELAESEARYRNVVETQTELICRYLPDTTLTFVNDAYCRFFERSREQLVGSRFLDLLPEDARAQTRAHIQKLIECPESVIYEHEVLLPDGTIGWQEWTDYVIARTDGIMELQGIGRDITQQKRTEIALRDAEERNLAILRAIPDLIFLQDKDGVYLDYHPKENNQLNLPQENFVGKRMAEVLPPELEKQMQENFNRSISTASLQLSDCTTEIDGKRKWFEVRTAPCNGSKVLTVVRDITQRKTAEAALEESEEFNRRIVESSTDCIKVLDLHGNLLYISQNGQLMLGMTELKPYLNSSWIDLWNGGAKSAAAEAVQRAARGENAVFLAEGTTLDGHLKWWNTVLTPIRSEDGKVERLLAISRDVTDQKLAAEAIQRGKDRFAKAFNANPQPMSLTTLNEGRYIDVNESFLEMSGYTREQVIGNTSNELSIFETPAHRALLIEPLLLKGEAKNMELKFRTNSGKFRVLLSSAELLDIDGERCVLVASSDITERKQLEENLRLSEREFSTLVENSPDIISRLDRDLRYIYISPSLERITGAPTERFIGKTQREASLPGYDWRDFETHCRSAFTKGKTVTRSFVFKERNYWTRIIPEFSKTGDVESVMTISEDVTNRMRVEKELVELTVRLFNIQDEERRRIARELHDGTAQNLFAISINVAKLMQGDEVKPELAELLLTECQSLVDQSLKEIRTLSYLLHPPLLDQSGLVSALQWYAEGFSKRSGIYVDVIAQPIGRLSSEVETALFRVVQEALTNVRRHSCSETASIRLERRTGEIKLEIKDRGRGLPPVKESRSDGVFELGVGIPGMKQRLRQLGGKLEISSSELGTSIIAVVPVANGASVYANSAGG
jgi:PAS domain S-box-containing protein